MTHLTYNIKTFSLIFNIMVPCSNTNKEGLSKSCWMQETWLLSFDKKETKVNMQNISIKDVQTHCFDGFQIFCISILDLYVFRIWNAHQNCMATYKRKKLLCWKILWQRYLSKTTFSAQITRFEYYKIPKLSVWFKNLAHLSSYLVLIIHFCI